uniref:Uncharacterized protein n=1 Tax=Solanum lycopersicum TaxID=4081 RepID=A0A3Q7GBB7_SOLLC
MVYMVENVTSKFVKCDIPCSYESLKFPLLSWAFLTSGSINGQLCAAVSVGPSKLLSHVIFLNENDRLIRTLYYKPKNTAS